MIGAKRKKPGMRLVPRKRVIWPGSFARSGPQIRPSAS